MTPSEIYDLASVAAGITRFPQAPEILRAQGLLRCDGPGHFALTELGEAHIRRLSAVPIMHSETTFDDARRIISIRERRARFYPSEWVLLKLLWKHLGALVSNEAMHSTLVNEIGSVSEADIVRVHLCKMRKQFVVTKLPLKIETIWGEGVILSEVKQDG